MALEFKQLVTLAKTVARADISSPVAYSFGDKKFSYGDLQDTLREELNNYAGTYALYRENKNKIFALMEETFDDVLPQKVIQMYSQFAEIKTFNQGDRPIFTQKITNASRRRAKQFIGKVGLAGLYEAFRLDGRSYEVTTNAIGGAAQIGFEEFLDKRVDFADVLDIVMEGLDECIYIEIAKQLYGAIGSMNPNNYTTQTAFVESKMDELLSKADSYGHSTIYCSYEFAGSMVPSTGWISPEMMNQRWGTGYLATYKGHSVIVLPQTWEEDAQGRANGKKVINPAYAFIIPTGADKPVKIAFEGGAIVDEYTNYDRSREIQIYKKVGVRAIFSDAICVYHNSSLH